MPTGGSTNKAPATTHLARVCVVEAHQQPPLVHLCKLLVEQRGLGVADVQEARGLGREAGHHLAHHSVGQPDVKAASVCKALI
jgi:hypothetical protein